MSSFPTHLLVPSALAAEGRATRRALRRRRFLALVVVVLLVIPPVALTWFARDGHPADGTLTYPNHWTATGAELQEVVLPSAASVTPEACPGGLQRRDVVTDVNGRPLDDWLAQDRQSVGLDRATYAVQRGGDACEVEIRFVDYPWREVIEKHALVLPLVGVLWLVAGFVFLSRPRDAAAQALFAASVVLPYTGLVYPFGTQVVDLLGGPRLWPLLVGDVAYVLLWGSMLHFALAFPRPVPFMRRSSVGVLAYTVPFLPYLAVVGVWALSRAATGSTPSTLDRLSTLAAVSPPASFVMPPLLALVVVWQYRHAASSSERQRVRWIIYSAFATVAAYLVLFPVPNAFGAPLVSYDWVAVLFLGVPLVLGAAVLQYGLFDLQVLLSRSLVYGTLTLLLLVVPIAATGTWLVSTDRGPVDLTDARTLNVALVAALVVALFFLPLRHRLRRLVSRLIFGSRDDPYEVVARLSGGMQAPATGGPLLSSIAETVARTLRLPYVAIEARGQDGAVDVYDYGSRQAAVQAIPLTQQGEEVGRLLLGSGHRTEPFGPADQKLLELLAHQVGLAARNVLLASRLQRSLERAVSAREEERRRLRRDIHDGLGPMLAGSRMRLEVARQIVATQPETADGILEELASTQQQMIDDVRRLVDGLRPSVLDQQGLVSAIRERATAFSVRPERGTGLEVTVEDAPDLEPLPAAVEVAAYRIALEALTNVARHADATRCRVRLARSDALDLEVVDNGRGLPRNYVAGVGLSSMRERAAEVGGSCVVRAGTRGGTVVRARLPIHLVKQ